MAGEIYLSNLVGNFDYQQMLDSIRALKSQQLYLLQSKEGVIKDKKSAISDYGSLLRDFKSAFDSVTAVGALDKKKVFVSDDTVLDVVINNPHRINTTAADAGLNINASIFYDGSQHRLLIQGKDTGSANTVSISDSGNLSSTLGNFYNAQTAQNAQISVYGNTVESSTNSFDNVIAGLTINVKSVSTTSVSINIQEDYDPFVEDLKKMIDKYNEIVDFIKNNTGEDGVLSDERTTLQTIRSGIFKRLDPIFQLGIINVDKDTGHISIDETELKNQLLTDRSSVETKIGDLKTQLNDYLVYITGTDGPVKLKEKSYDKQIQNIEDMIQLQSKRIDEEIQTLKRQFVALQQLMAQMEDIRQRIASTFGNVSLLNQ